MVGVFFVLCILECGCNSVYSWHFTHSQFLCAYAHAPIIPWRGATKALHHRHEETNMQIWIGFFGLSVEWHLCCTLYDRGQSKEADSEPRRLPPWRSLLFYLLPAVQQMFGIDKPCPCAVLAWQGAMSQPTSVVSLVKWSMQEDPLMGEAQSNAN